MHTCNICENSINLIMNNHPGYVKGTSYDIYECKVCKTRSAVGEVNLETDLNRVYDLIYNNGKKVPGYNRYFSLANNILKQEKPFEWLASQGLEYWHVRNHLLLSSQDSDKILEIGCGFGYLTYAMKKSNYNAIGIDLSKEVIEMAQAQFGEGFSNDKIQDFIQKKEKFDLIILTEVIEHIPDPIELIMECKKILSQNGAIFITTPNRSIYTSQLAWSVEAPPVHLWWFNSTGIFSLAQRCNLKCTILSGTSSPWAKNWKKISTRHSVNKFNIFNEEGELIHDKIQERNLYRLGIIKQIKAWIEKIFYKQADLNPTLAVKLTFDNQ